MHDAYVYCMHTYHRNPFWIPSKRYRTAIRIYRVCDSHDNGSMRRFPIIAASGCNAPKSTSAQAVGESKMTIGTLGSISAIVVAIALIAVILISWSVVIVTTAAFFAPLLPFWAWCVILALSLVITGLIKLIGN